ncbi:unnamed protein product, partial [Ceratitis capitata]
MTGNDILVNLLMVITRVPRLGFCGAALLAEIIESVIKNRTFIITPVNRFNNSYRMNTQIPMYV